MRTTTMTDQTTTPEIPAEIRRLTRTEAQAAIRMGAANMHAMTPEGQAATRTRMAQIAAHLQTMNARRKGGRAR